MLFCFPEVQLSTGGWFSK